MRFRTALQAAFAAACFVFAGLFSASLPAQSVTSDGVTVCTFGNPDRSDTSSSHWNGGQGWSVLSKICYDRRLGVGLQAGKGAMQTAFQTPVTLAWVEVTGCVTSQVGVGHEVLLNLQLDEHSAVGLRQVESSQVFVIPGQSVPVTVRFVLEEPMACERIILASAETNSKVLTVMEVRWGAAPEPVKAQVNLPSGVGRGETFVVTATCSGGTGSYTALRWTFGDEAGMVVPEAGEVWEAGAAISFAAQAPAQAGPTEFVLTAVDSASSEGTVSCPTDVWQAMPVTDLTVTGLTPTGLTLSWTLPPEAPERLRVTLSRTSDVTVAVPDEADRTSASLSFYDYTGGSGGILVPVGVLAEVSFGYSWNGGTPQELKPGMFISVPAGYPQELTLTGLPDAAARELKLSVDSLVESLRPEACTYTFDGVRLAGQRIQVGVTAGFADGSEAQAVREATVPTLLPPASVSVSRSPSGGYAVRPVWADGGHYGYQCDVLLERLETAETAPAGLLLTRAFHTEYDGVDLRAAVLTNATARTLSLKGYVLRTYNPDSAAADALDLGLLEPNVLPPWSELYVAYRPSGSPDRILFPGGVMPSAPVFASGSNVMRYYESRQAELLGPSGEVLSTVPPTRQHMTELPADGTAYRQTPLADGACLPERFFEPWAGLPRWHSERAASRLGTGELVFTPAEANGWLTSPGLGRIRVSVRTCDSLGQMSEPVSAVLWTAEPEPETLPGFLFRLR